MSCKLPIKIITEYLSEEVCNAVAILMNSNTTVTLAVASLLL